MNYFHISLENSTKNNKYYRKVLFTNRKIQLVVMSIPPNGEIGTERHKGKTQFIKIERGTGLAVINGKKIILKQGDGLVIQPNQKHNIINTGLRSLKIYSIYSPPEHKKGLKMKLF